MDSVPGPVRLINTYKKLQDGDKVIDVSTLGADGKGWHTIPFPKQKTSTRRYVPGIPVVSNNYPCYLRAMQFLGDEFLIHADKYMQLYGNLPPPPPRPSKPICTYQSTTTTSKPTSSGGDKFVTAYHALKDTCKVLDVSTLTTEGTGFRTVDQPKTDRGKRKKIDPVPIISNNYDTYLIAMQFLGPTYDQFALQYYNQYCSNAPSDSLPVPHNPEPSQTSD